MKQETSKKILLTGVRASGDIHLGNYLGAMKPALERQRDYHTHLFVADLHGLTTNPSPQELYHNTFSISAAWLAAGVDTQNTILWRQSDVPEVLELAYILSCVTSMGLLERAHSFKDAKAKEEVVKAGLFMYPVLMAADILLYNTDCVPVGKDQKQHLEMTRDMATFFNETYVPIFKLPEGIFMEDVATIPGTDGKKMSKSYSNGIDIFADEKELKKQIMSIKTDSKTLEEPKEAEGCLVYQIFKLIGEPKEAHIMKERLEKGNYGYGEAKKTLMETLLTTLGPMRKEYSRLMQNPGDIEAQLKKGAERAREEACKMMKQVRQAIGL